MEAAKSAANEEMQENKHTDYIYMVTGDRLVISMNAELDHHLADEMRDVIDTIIEERGVRHLIFDFSKISFMDSSGIGLIMGRYKKLQENGSISIAGANDSIQRIILISGLHKLVHTCKDVSQAAKNIEKNKLWCIFQPHTYSRTYNLLDEFSEAFDDADKIVVADIYAAREKDTGLINSSVLVERIKQRGGDAVYVGGFDEIKEYIRQNCSEGDLLITMGAGDVVLVGEALIK